MGQFHEDQEPELSVGGKRRLLSAQELKGVLASQPGELSGAMSDFFIPVLAAPMLQKDVAKRVQGKCTGAKPQPLHKEGALYISEAADNTNTGTPQAKAGWVPAPLSAAQCPTSL